MSINETLYVIPSFEIPIPTSNLGIFWVLLGMQFGRSFGKRLDQGIQAGVWFKSLSPSWQGLVKRLLDFTHHWWVGGLLWLYADLIVISLGIPQHSTAIMFFGIGLLIDDARDIENLKRRFNGTE